MIVDNIEVYPTKYEGYYISKDGKLYSSKSHKFLRKKTNKYGYGEYTISINSKRKTIGSYRLVAETFLPNPECKPTVNHKNGIRSDDRVDNLEWNTWSENNQHRYTVLKNIGPNKWKIDIYKNNILIYQDLSMQEYRDLKFSYTLVKLIQKNQKNIKFMYFERMQSKINVYWNGTLFKVFESDDEAAEFFHVKKNNINYLKNHVHERRKFYKEYRIEVKVSY